MSFKPEVMVSGETKWAANATRFATKDEAERYVADLMWRWTSVKETRVVDSEDPVNYRWDNATGLQSIEKEVQREEGGTQAQAS